MNTEPIFLNNTRARTHHAYCTRTLTPATVCAYVYTHTLTLSR